MTDKIWLGGIYLKEEGGYEIIEKALNHYKNRLKTLNDSPELKDSGAAFASILNQQARKTIPKINEVIEKIHVALHDKQVLRELEGERQFLEKSLRCYESDIHKAEDIGHEYFTGLIVDMIQGRKDLKTIKEALEKISIFSD